MALVHGTAAVGAKGIREGFAWNPRMDLLWALGYPQVLLIVDGFPAEDTKQGNLAYWDPEQKSAQSDGDWWMERCFQCDPRLLSRRGAQAVLWELEHRASAFALPEDELMDATQPRELTPTRARAPLAQRFS
jgi:hypothetical protein